MRLTHTRMQLMMGFVGGLMMGVAILHLLPHAVVQTGSLDYAAWSCMLGLLAMFLTIRVFNVHQHGPVSEPDGDEAASSHHEHQHQHAHHDCTAPRGTAGRRQASLQLVRVVPRPGHSLADRRRGRGGQRGGRGESRFHVGITGQSARSSRSCSTSRSIRCRSRP